MTIRTDATRLLLRPAEARAPRAVTPRQGQVLLDTDLAETSRLILDRIDTGTDDTLGSPGRFVVPAGGPGFAVTAAASPADCGLAAGHGYLGGWKVQNAADCTLATQPHPRTDAQPQAPVLLVLKALTRHIDPVEEPAWADRGLGDAQAGGRALTDWQVFPFAPANGFAADFGCATALLEPDYAALIAPSTGTLAVSRQQAGPGLDPCQLTAQGGYTRGENLLYRIEVHGGVPRADLPQNAGPRYGLDGLRIKLSRRNASVLVRITAVAGAEISVEPPSLDPLNWFAPGLWAEFVSVHDDVDPPEPGTEGERLFRVASADDARVTLEAGAAAFAATIAQAEGWFLRLWDSFPGPAAEGAITVDTTGHPNTGQEMDLGDGLIATLGGGAGATFRRGDHWTFAARSDGFVDWPDGQAETPHGPDIRFAPLAAVLAPANAPTAEDCRIPAATLTDRSLLYRGGDGQAVPVSPNGGFVRLPVPLRVAVMRGRIPVAGATVRWQVPPGMPACRIDATPCGPQPVDRVTDAEGLCEVPWDIDSGQPAVPHLVEATLLAPDGSAAPQPVRFAAAFRTALATSYQPGACDLLAGETTVQGALDQLCANIGGSAEPESLRLSRILLVGRQGQTELIRGDMILNGLHLPNNAFVGGIGFGFEDARLLCQPDPRDPIVEISLDLPYPTTDPDRQYWQRAADMNRPFGYQTIRLDGLVRVFPDGEGEFPPGLAWLPTPATQQFLATMPGHLGGQRVLGNIGWTEPMYDSLVCRIGLKAAQIFGRGRDGRRIRWLNAEHLGTSRDVMGRELMLDERDPQRAGDLDIFTYLHTGERIRPPPG